MATLADALTREHEEIDAAMRDFMAARESVPTARMQSALASLRRHI